MTTTTTPNRQTESSTRLTLIRIGIDSNADAAHELPEVKEAEKALVIPEKASSFRIHPDKLCQDQCFYCGGKFGLFDTPCHVAGIKSVERQRKILDSK